MRRKQEQVVGNVIHFFKDDKGKFLVVVDNVKLKDVLENLMLLRELYLLRRKSNDVEFIVDKASTHIHASLQSDFVRPSWPYHSFDLKEEAINLPYILGRFLAGGLK